MAVATVRAQWVLVVILLQMLHSVTSFKCYVCSPDSGRPEDMYTLRKSFPTHAIQPCSSYTRHNKHQYLLECPHGGNNGCLTKFAANGSVMRTCAPIAIEDCKEANGINYCYCKKEGCNTPERRLASAASGPREEQPAASSLGQSQAAARVAVSDKSFTRYFDDEDMVEGSGDWGDFYYDDYNYIESRGGHHYPDHGLEFDDTEFGGDGAHDESDVTEPPPFLDLETPAASDPRDRHRHKFDREHARPGARPGLARGDSGDITIAEDTTLPPRTAGAWSVSPRAGSCLVTVLLILVAELLVRT